MDLLEFWGDPISVYTRAQALADGELVDLTAWASNGPEGMIGGFALPLAVTRAVWSDITNIPQEWRGIQDVRGRGHDVLWMALCAASLRPDADRVEYQVIMDVAGDATRERTYVLHCGPGDDGEPVLTIMAPGED